MKKYLAQFVSWMFTGFSFLAYFKLQDEGLIRFLPLVFAILGMELYAWAGKKYA